MKKQNQFDIIVIGAGSGGLNIASFMNKAGFKVLLVDKSENNIGGDCLNYGCVPSKALIHISDVIYKADQAEQFGLQMGGQVDFGKVREYILAKQNKFRKHESSSYLKSVGIEVVLGGAKFISKNEITVNGNQFKGNKIVIATGARPRKLNVPGIENVKVYDNETIFDLSDLPARLLVVGGGPIGLEIGQAFSRLGSQVEIVQRENQFLSKEAVEVADVLLEQFNREDIKIHFRTEIKKFTSINRAILGNGGSSRWETEFDAVFIAIGRVPNVENLDLEKAGIDVINNRLIINDKLQTTNKNVFACGDVVGSFQFTHVAEYHAQVILNNLFSPFKKKADYSNLSWVTYTYPQVATFGKNERQLKEEKVKFQVIQDNFKDDDRAIIDNYPKSFVKIYVSGDQVLGGTMVAPNAGELVQELILAQNSRIELDKLFQKIYPYPTAARINKRLVSSYYSERLTEFNKKLLHFLIKL